MAQKKYSIITINFNNKEGLRKTIESVICQSYKDFEYIIIDGGSVDGSIEVIQEYADKVDYWVSEPDHGIYNAMNKGILQARGEYLIFMNSGDCFHDAGVLDKVAPWLQSDIVTGEESRMRRMVRQDITMFDFIKGTIPHQASFIKRELFAGHLYDENYKIVSDWKFFIEAVVLRNCSFRKIEVVICDFDPTGIGSVHPELNEKERREVLESLFPERVLKDYELFLSIDSPALVLLPELSKTNGFEQLLCHIMLWLIRVRRFYMRIKRGKRTQKKLKRS